MTEHLGATITWKMQHDTKQKSAAKRNEDQSHSKNAKKNHKERVTANCVPETECKQPRRLFIFFYVGLLLPKASLVIKTEAKQLKKKTWSKRQSSSSTHLVLKFIG